MSSHIIAPAKLSQSKETLSCYADNSIKKYSAGFGLTFKFTNFENRIVRYVLEKQSFQENIEDHGMHISEFIPSANSNNCTFLANNNCVLIWSSGVVKSNIYSNLARFQKINHFPRSYEITRKDSLSERFAKMQALYGHKNFNFMP